MVKPILLQVLGDSSWDRFCTKLATLESELDNSRIRAIEAGTPVDDEKLYEPIVKFLEPIQKKIRISLTDIRFLRSDRNSMFHIPQKTVPEQYLLIEKAKNFTFSERFEFTEQVKDMISSLEQKKSDFHRCNI